MNDLISRAAAIAEVEQWAEHGHEVLHWTGIKAMLEVQPAVDAVPVVHAHWINHYDDIFPEDSMIECSACHEYMNYMACDNFCQNCGAKMDGRDGE